MRFYDGNPLYGIQIGPDQRIASLPAAGRVTLTVDWLSVPGVHTISVVADPLNTVVESREDNNKGEAIANVPGSVMSELGLHQNDIVLTQLAPTKGEAIAIQATIHNTGANAQNVLVLFYLGPPSNGGAQIGSSMIPDLPANSITTISTPWPVDIPAGTYEIYVWIDPYDAISEGNENDNLVFRSVNVAEKKLFVGVTADRMKYPASADVGITAIVRNDTARLWYGMGTIDIEDERGNRVATVTTFTVADLKSAGPAEWAYRIPVPVAAGWDMKDALAATEIDFVPVLAGLGISGKTIDQNSIRVIEFDALGNLIGEKQARTVFRTNTAATVVWLMDGPTRNGAPRYFFLYFDTTDRGSKAPSATTTLPRTGRLIAISDDTGRINVVESNGDGTFGTLRLVEDISTATDYTRGIVLDDFNNDGFVDIVTGTGSTGDIYYYQNKADGTNTFAPKVKIGAITADGYIMDMTAADFDRDGNMDFIVSKNALNQLYLFRGNGYGTFVRSNLAVPSGTNYFRGKTAADADGDGLKDIIVANSSGVIYLYRGKGDGTFLVPVQITTIRAEPYGLTAGDFDGDHKVDIVVNKGSTGDGYLLKGIGGGTFRSPTLIPSLDTNNTTAFDAGDFNNDGRLDIIAATHTTRTVEFFPGRGDGTCGAKNTITTTATHNTLGISSSPALPEAYPTVGGHEPVPSQTVTAVWNTGATSPGIYRARVMLSEGAGTVAEIFA